MHGKSRQGRSILFQLAAQIPDDPLFQPGDIALRNADAVCHFFLGMFLPAAQTEPHFHNRAFPRRQPGYDAVFVFLDDGYSDPAVPPWALKVILDERGLA